MVAFAVCASATTGSYAGVVLSPEDGRLWQTVFKSDEPLSWRWEDGAVRAEVSFSNLVTEAAMQSAIVTRGDGAVCGSCTLPDPVRSEETGDGLVDAVLVQYDTSDAVLYRKAARLAFLPGVAGGAFTVEKGGTRFRKLSGTRVVPYDPLWTDAASAEIATRTFTPVKGAAIVEELPKVGGYFTQTAATGELSVQFDGVLGSQLVADIVSRGGLMILFR